MLVKGNFLPQPDAEQASAFAAPPLADSDAARMVSAQDVAMIVHELRSPLMAMIGYGQILGQVPDARGRAEVASRLEQTGMHMLALVNDLLDMAKSGAGQMHLRHVPVNTLRLMMDSLAVVESVAQSKGLTLHLDMDYGFPLEFMGDPQRLRQILINLLSNATKFTDRGKVTLRAWVDLTVPCLTFTVEDQGVGMTDDEVQTLFHPFRQILQDGASQEGTGLGLVISRNLAVAMGGKLCVTSQPGRGSHFAFSLPFCHKMTDEDGPPSNGVSTPISVSDSMMRRFKQAGASLPPQTCLVVDDNEMLRDLIGSLLKSGGHHVDTVGTGTEALARVAEQAYDLVLLDGRMPGIDGYETARRMRAMFAPGTGPLLVGLSGIVTEEDEKTATDCGMDALFSKATNPLGLIDTITQLMAKSRRQRG